MTKKEERNSNKSNTQYVLIFAQFLSSIEIKLRSGIFI